MSKEPPLGLKLIVFSYFIMIKTFIDGEKTLKKTQSLIFSWYGKEIMAEELPGGFDARILHGQK